MFLRNLPTLFSFCLVLLFSTSAHGQWVQRSNGIRTGSPISYTMSGTTIFAGTFYDGVYRSTDGGVTWKSTGKGLNHNAWVSSLAAKNNKIYTGDYFNGVFISADNGDTWTALSTGLSNMQVSCLTFIGNDLFAATNNGLNVLRENATSWSPIGTGFGTAPTILAIGKSGNSLFASVYNRSVFRSDDNGATWVSAANGLTSASVTAFRQNGSNTYACTSEGLYVTADNGSLWTKVAGLSSANVGDILIDGLNMLAATSIGPFKSMDGGTTWNLSNTGFGFYYSSVFLNTGSKILLGGYGSGIYSTTDFGNTWTDTGEGFASVVVKAFETINGKLLAGTAKGIYRSTDNGNTWEPANTGIFNLGRAYTSQFLKDGTRIYAAFDGIGVMFTDNEANSWTDFSTGLTGSTVYCLAKKGSTLFAGTAHGVFKYSSASASWILSTSGIPLNDNGSSINVIRSLTVIGEKLFAGVSNNGIYQSTDDGNSWTKMDSQVSDENITKILLKGDSLFATGNRDVYFSVDQGVNWTKTVTNNINSLETIFTVDGALFAAGWNGVYCSLDNGVSWMFLKDGFPEIAAAYSFFSDGTSLFAGTSQGVWSIPLTDFYPSIQSVSPGAGGPNEFIQIIGKNFNPAVTSNKVFFNGKSASILQGTSTSLTATVPVGATFGYVTVIVNNKTAKSPDTFCVRPAGPVISGTGFGSEKIVLSSNVPGIQWYLNGLPIAGATSTTYNVTHDGVYTAKIVGGSCDSQPSNPIVIIVTGVEESSSMQDDLAVYPNPAAEHITVTMKKGRGGWTVIEIFDVKGHRKEYLKVESGTSREISLSGYNEGLYFLRASSPEKTTTRRFIKTSTGRKNVNAE